MLKILPLYKKTLLISATLGASLLPLSVYACDFTDPSGAERLSKKRPAEGEPSGAEQHRNKKLKTQKTDDDLSVDLAQDTFLSEDSFCDVFPEELIPNISSFLNPKDLKNLALSSKAFYTPARQALIHADIRDLKNKEWVGGPTKGTFENYLFNSVLWKMGDSLIHSTKNNKSISIFSMSHLLKGHTYLKDQFKDYKPCQNVSDAFCNLSNYHQSDNGTLMATHAADHPMGGEADFLSLIHYVLENGKNYVLPDHIREPMSLVENHRVKTARRQLDNAGTDLDQTASLWELIVTYDLDRDNDFERCEAAIACFKAGCASLDPLQRFTFFERAISLRDIMSENIQDDPHAKIIDAQERCDIAKESLDSKQKLSIFFRAAQTFYDTFQEDEYEPDEEELTDAATAHYAVGTLSGETSQKHMFFTRAAELFDALFALNPEQPIACLEEAVAVYDFIGEADKSQKIRARMKNLAAPQHPS